MTRRRALASVAALGVVLVVALDSPRRGERAESSTSAPVSVAAPLPSQDPQDRDRRLARRLRQPQQRRPAIQGLPFRGDGIAIDFAGVDRRGRLAVVVTYTGSRSAARRAYRRFLAYWRDDGSDYVVTYGSNRETMKGDPRSSSSSGSAG